MEKSSFETISKEPTGVGSEAVEYAMGRRKFKACDIIENIREVFDRFKQKI